MKKKNQILKIFSPVLVLVLAVGCARYNSKPLPKIQAEIQEINNIKVSKKILDDKETEEIFGKNNCNQLSKKSIQPIILNIKNKSDQNYTLYSDDMNLKLENPNKISKMLHKNTSLRVTSWCIGGLFAWPCFIGAAIDGTSSKNYNKDLNKDINIKALYPHENIKIKSNETISKIIFVNKTNNSSQLNLKLINNKDKTQEIEFIV